MLIEMRTGGTAEYNHETYECINADVCRIENGRVTAGTIRVSEPSTAENPTPIPNAHSDTGTNSCADGHTGSARQVFRVQRSRCGHMAENV